MWKKTQKAHFCPDCMIYRLWQRESVITCEKARHCLYNPALPGLFRHSMMIFCQKTCFPTDFQSSPETRIQIYKPSFMACLQETA